ncbi:hypothetical protein [uncultured Brachyspira sp.]|uniref:hypothetical protein n=1 Tax=uncultured Brachyspira sp. TaxID=221953 RepID=UPI003207930C
MTQKNKIFSIILSLLVLSSVACRKSGGGNGGGVVTEPGTFSITEASGNVKALVVKPETTASDIKIAFSSSADYTAEFTVEDTAETVEINKITSEDFEFANNSLTAKTTLVDKVRKLDSSSQTVDKTIKINFTFKAKDTTLKNNTKTLSIEVKLTKELAFKPSSLVGNWSSDKHKFTMTADGKITTISIDGISASDYTITDWADKKDTEVPQYTATIKSQSSGGHTYDFLFTFTSGSNCIVTITEQGQTSTAPKNFTFTKDATATAK